MLLNLYVLDPCVNCNGMLVTFSCPSRVQMIFNFKMFKYICRRVILPVALYGCETWSLTLKEERRLRVFENRVLRRVFGPK